MKIKKRQKMLVKENMKRAQNAVKGITTTLKETNMSMSSIQAAWLDYKNYTAKEGLMVRDKKGITIENGKRKLIKISEEPIKTRFIVSRVVDRKGKALATWMLITNVKKVKAKTIAKWYYYGWNIESYFKLLKTTGFNLEKWQKPLALFKRLIVVAYAIIFVFKLANSNDENAKKIREFLVKLSGKVMEYGVEYTLPAFLIGLWVFLCIMDVLDNFSIEELNKLKNQAQDIILSCLEFEMCRKVCFFYKIVSSEKMIFSQKVHFTKKKCDV